MTAALRRDGVIVMDWTQQDLEDLSRRGIPLEEAERQLALLREPSRSVVLARPATAGDGITVVSAEEVSELAAEGTRVAERGRVTKFVPASGAATRMFRDLAPALEPGASLNGAPARFLRKLDRFPFADELTVAAREHGIEPRPDMSDDEKRVILRLLLTDEGLGYADLAKGLIAFHRYDEESRTAFEEQIREGVSFASDGSVARFHFTVPSGDVGRFFSEAERVSKLVTDEMGVRPEIGFSVQHPATDTIAIAPDGEPFRQDDGSLFLRPGGHGALLRNLSELEGDVVFIKNIDNVLPSHAQGKVATWYRVLIGVLARVEDRVTNAIRSLDEDGETSVVRASSFVAGTFGRPWRGSPRDLEGQRDHLLDVLRRPIRVCAVVRNEGEPGGAPFLVRGDDGRESLQIVESSQIDVTDSNQKKIFGSSTHFNPVAIACSLRDRAGAPYDLGRYVDPSTAFVANKSHQGRELRALEHPGLWNGAMAEWLSLFVELPPFTFAPVKTVFDLLRDEHQTQEGVP